MIRYNLRCDQGHDFDGWFRSSDGFDNLRAAGQVTCTQCGSAKVEKALMAPAVPAKAPLSQAQTPQEKALEKLRAHVEQNSEHVGLRFADEARAMHEGRSKTRAIHGQARPEDARKLIEDGVPVLPLPFRPREGVN